LADDNSLLNREKHEVQGTLAHATLPGAAFHPGEYDIEATATTLADADELLKATLEEALQAVNGTRAFLAFVDSNAGELVVRFTAGEGWNEQIRRLRLDVQEKRDPENDSEVLRQGITRYVVINSRSYWTGNVHEDPHYKGFFPDVNSEVAVPVMAREGGCIGVINIESVEPNAFDGTHATRLVNLARRAATIISMTEHQLREEALIGIGRDLNNAADLDTLMNDVVEQAVKILRADDCSLFLMEEDQETKSTMRAPSSSTYLKLEASHSLMESTSEIGAVRYHLGEGLTGWVAEHGKVIRVGDPRTDSRWKGVFLEAPAGEIAAVMAVPVQCGRGNPGVLRVVRRRKGSLYFLPQEFTSADEDILLTLAGQLAVAIDRTRLLNRLLNAERMAAWGEMSARSAHMIGNAVFGVKGHINELAHILAQESRGLIGDDNPDAALFRELTDLTKNVTQGIYRLEEILGEFRDFVLATQLHLTEADINQVLRDVSSESFPKDSNVDLVMNLVPGLPGVEIDEAKLKRAFSELVENSVDFQPDGGKLEINSSLADREVLNWLGGAARKGVRIDFIDSGPGLSEQDRERVFTPFYTRKAKGMGLGLSIVKGIVEAHGGAIREVGENHDPSESGAHFVVVLPVQ
jgi:signal transduction histidine kinase/putative methionine-R-sulfoxide reductase with GAF domain